MSPVSTVISTAPAMTLLPVDDLPRAVRFYTETLGLPVELFSDMPGHAFVRLAGGHRAHLFLDGRARAGHATLTFSVDDLGTATDELVAEGVTVERCKLWTVPEGVAGPEAARATGVAAACFTDTEGNGLCIHEALA
jgi:predicted enzyme related to lactoylglutathione lyase